LYDGAKRFHNLGEIKKVRCQARNHRRHLLKTCDFPPLQIFAITEPLREQFFLISESQASHYDGLCLVTATIQIVFSSLQLSTRFLLAKGTRKMTRRIVRLSDLALRRHLLTHAQVRSSLQLGFLVTIVLSLVYLLDSRYRVLPSSIHSHLPTHHAGLVITDITVKTCSFSSCKLDPDQWYRIEKDLYLKTGWITKAYVHVQRKQEEQLTPDDKVVMDVKVGRLDPSTQETADKAEKWEKRDGGIWLKRSSKRHDSDSKNAVTAVDVLFGADAVEPRPGWEIKDPPLLLDNDKDTIEAKLTIRRGTPPKIEKPVPRVRRDGKFKIMQISDLHLSTGLGVCRDPEPPKLNGAKCEADPRTLDFIGRQLDFEKPDLVVLSGDQVNGDSAPDAQSAIFKFAELLIYRKIPFACIFGNHDDEGSITRSATAEILSTLPYSLTIPGPNTIPGVGNYYVQVLAHSTHNSALTLYFLDTHSYSPDEKKYKGYDWIKPEQIKWFKDTASTLKADNAKYSHIHLDMAFIHIPLPEYRNGGIRVGESREKVTAPAYNTGFRDALVEMGIPVVSCGHDHANDYCLLSEGRPSQRPSPSRRDNSNQGSSEPSKAASEQNAHQDNIPASVYSSHERTTKNDKIWLCYAGGSGFGGYGGYGGYIRRIRVFEFDANEARITTWKKLEYGEVGKRLDEQIIVEGGRVVADAG
jgi:3',5'-cyclic AMP phosphodiesterase CpdA